jgi:hypothetical protein
MPPLIPPGMRAVVAAAVALAAEVVEVEVE